MSRLSSLANEPPLARSMQEQTSRPSRGHAVSEATFSDYRKAEGREHRESRLRAVWERLPSRCSLPKHSDPGRAADHANMSPELAERLRAVYQDELARRCSRSMTEDGLAIGLKEFLEYADEKEAELWSTFNDELDLDNDGHLGAEDLAKALGKAGITLDQATLNDFIDFLTSRPQSEAITWPEFRDFLILLPRHASATEIYRYYQTRKFSGEDGCGTVRVNMKGNVSRNTEDRPLLKNVSMNHSLTKDLRKSVTLGAVNSNDDAGGEDFVHDHKAPHNEPWWSTSPTARYLLAGGVAGMVSRTATAPFDRLKIFLITRPPDLGGLPGTSAVAPTQGVKALLGALARIYSEGGVRGFWVGNGLNLVKIFPESAIKFMTYEQSKLLFAKYWDRVDDPRNISGSSRFLSGGAGGIVSQLFIYPIETVKTQIMSSTGDQSRSLSTSMRRLWVLGGFPAYYRGLTIGIIGVFPYSAIDMSTFEALKIAYTRSTAQEEPGVLALLAFGSLSGSIGATTVYPLNLVRTRLQASGSSGHPEKYTGIWDVARKTFQREGWRGFYRGLLPTLAKVVPSVSITYVVYEQSKRRLGV